MPHTYTDLLAQAVVDSPLGPLRLAASAKGLAGLWFEDQKHHPGTLSAPLNPEQTWIAQACAELARYWADPSTAHFSVPLDLQGTAFQLAVWQALQNIRPGQTGSYGELAAQLGYAGAARAIGAAVGRNPVSIIVPCHRVVGQNGALTGYAGGIVRKQALLSAEGAPGHRLPQRPPQHTPQPPVAA